MSEKDGGQAFPHGDPAHGGDVGMSLRDYFAAKAMAAIVSEAGSDCHEDIATKRAYAIADAMLKARAER